MTDELPPAQKTKIPTHARPFLATTQTLISMASFYLVATGGVNRLSVAATVMSCLLFLPSIFTFKRKN
jgi:hypothetical protein